MRAVMEKKWTGYIGNGALPLSYGGYGFAPTRDRTRDHRLIRHNLLLQVSFTHDWIRTSENRFNRTDPLDHSGTCVVLEAPTGVLIHLASMVISRSSAERCNYNLWDGVFRLGRASSGGAVFRS